MSLGASVQEPQLIGHEPVFNRQIWLLQLRELRAAFDCSQLRPQKFSCLCVIKVAAASTDEVSGFCRRLIELGCGYFCAWGQDCERVHDIMDELIVGDNPPDTYIGCLMTTWHAKESLSDAINYFLTCTVPDDEYAPDGCAHGLVVEVGSPEWATGVEKLLRESMRHA